MSLRAIDADGHISEWHIDWAARLPEEFRSRAPRSIQVDAGMSRTLIDGLTFPDPAFEGAGRIATREMKGRVNPQGMSDPNARIGDMEVEGIERAVLFGTQIMFHGNTTSDWRLAAAISRAWNDWAGKEYCAAHPDRLFFSAVIPLSDMGAAVEEARRAVQELGAVAVTVQISHQGRSLDNPYFDPLWATIQDLDVPMAVHASMGTKYLPAIGYHEQWIITHALAMPMGLTYAVGSIILGGVMARFPRLKVAILEGGCGWLPFYVDRLDEHYEKLPKHLPDLDRKPSEYIKSDRFFISVEPEEELRHVIETIGADRLLYISDYAHWDCDFPNSVKAIGDRPSLTDQEKRLILRDNAIRLYKLPVKTPA